MYDVNSSLFIRIPFEILLPADRIQEVELRMKYGDGFIAYLNGQEVARANAGEGAPSWDAAALMERSPTTALFAEFFDLTEFKNLLTDGPNLLAIQLLTHNKAAQSALVVPELRAVIEMTPYDAWLLDYPDLTGSAAESWSDPDGDGFPNILEFALGGDPLSAEDVDARKRMTAQTRFVESESGRYLEIAHRRRQDPAGYGLSYSLQFSPDLTPGSWRLAGSPLFPVTVEILPDDEGEWETVIVRLSSEVIDRLSSVFCRVWLDF